MPIDKKGYAKCVTRFERCTKAFEALETAKTLEDAQHAWLSFLESWHGFWILMGASVKHDPRARQWFGMAEKARRKDPLLQYVYQARNDEEHSLDSSSQLQRGSVSIGGSKDGASASIHIKSLSINSITGRFFADVRSLDGRPVRTIIAPPLLRLLDVRDRDKAKVVPVPTEHLGAPLKDRTPVTVARLALTHLGVLMEQAKAHL